MKLEGIVQRGEGNASFRYSVPTANIYVSGAEEGVFIGETNKGGDVYNALICVRSALVDNVASNKQILEAHLFDFSGDLYGTSIEVVIKQKIRDLVPFQDHESMRILIEEDVRKARAFLTPSP